MGVVHLGDRNPNWRGGRTIASNGYVLIRVGPGHHLADVRGYAYEHRLVAERNIGRRLKPGELVHHKDEDKQNNDPGNIQVVPDRRWHALAHRKRSDLRLPGQENPLVLCGCGCGGSFNQFDKDGRPRRFLPSHNLQAERK